MDSLAVPIALVAQSLRLVGAQAWQGLAALAAAVGAFVHAGLAPTLGTLRDCGFNAVAAAAPLLRVRGVGAGGRRRRRSLGRRAALPGWHATLPLPPRERPWLPRLAMRASARACPLPPQALHSSVVTPLGWVPQATRQLAAATAVLWGGLVKAGQGVAAGTHVARAAGASTQEVRALLQLRLPAWQARCASPAETGRRRRVSAGLQLAAHAASGRPAELGAAGRALAADGWKVRRAGAPGAAWPPPHSLAPALGRLAPMCALSVASKEPPTQPPSLPGALSLRRTQQRQLASPSPLSLPACLPPRPPETLRCLAPDVLQRLAAPAHALAARVACRAPRPGHGAHCGAGSAARAGHAGQMAAGPASGEANPGQGGASSLAASPAWPAHCCIAFCGAMLHSSQRGSALCDAILVGAGAGCAGGQGAQRPGCHADRGGTLQQRRPAH